MIGLPFLNLAISIFTFSKSSLEKEDKMVTNSAISGERAVKTQSFELFEKIYLPEVEEVIAGNVLFENSGW